MFVLPVQLQSTNSEVSNTACAMYELKSTEQRLVECVWLRLITNRLLHCIRSRLPAAPRCRTNLHALQIRGRCHAYRALVFGVANISSQAVLQTSFPASLVGCRCLGFCCKFSCCVLCRLSLSHCKRQQQQCYREWWADDDRIRALRAIQHKSMHKCVGPFIQQL